MYGIEYEDDILLLLRMIKFLHMQSPDAAHIFCQSYPVVDMEELLMVIDEVMWDIFDDVNFFFDEEYEATVVQCSHPIIDRLYEQGRASDPKHGSRQSVWSKKLHDITEYFVLGATNSVYKFSQHIAGDHVVLEFCLSPDYYEPLYFANSLVDLLRYCQCSIRRIEAKLAERETENICMTEYIRHQIHHPENTYNARFNDSQLRRSIEDMRAFVTSKAQTPETT